MSRPPIEGKVVQGVPGRTRADAAQKLLAPQKKTVSPIAVKRAALGNKAHALGSPLSAQVKSAGGAGMRRESGIGWRFLPQLLASLFAAAGLGLFLLGFAFFIVMLATGVLFGCGFVLGHALQSRRFTVLLTPEIDLAAEFDKFVDKNAAYFPSEAVDELGVIKASLMRLLSRLALIEKEGRLGQEDVFFIRQAVLRYLPDAGAPFTAIPPEKWDEAILAQGATPKQVLLEQFKMVTNKLRELEEKVIKSDAQKLAQHKRFLEQKTSD